MTTVEAAGLTPEDWDAAVDKIAAWVSPGDEGGAARFGVVNCHPMHGRGDAFAAAVWQRVVENDTDVLVVHVADRLDVEWLRAREPEARGPQPRALFPLHLYSYEDFCPIVETNHKEALAGPGGREQPSAWDDSRILPARVVLIIDVDPSGSAPFFVSMMALADLVHQTQGGRGSTESVGVLLVCTSPLEGPIRSLARAVVGPWRRDRLIEDFDLPPHAAPTGEPPGPLEMVECDDPALAIAEAIQGAKAGHLVMCFPPWARLDGLGEAGAVLHPVTGPVTMQTGKAFAKPDPEGRHRVLLLPHGFRAPFLVGGFEGVHVVLGEFGEHVIVNAQTGQLTSTTLTLTQAELVEQMAWASTSRCPPGSARVYANARAIACLRQPEDARGRVLQFENKHLLGVMAALSAMHGWGGEPPDLTGLFVRPRVAYQDRLYMLAQLGVVGSDALQSRRLTPHLPPGVREVFHAILPKVDYDPCLALFLALPGESRAVAAVKVQLGGLLAVGLDEIFESLSLGGTPDGLRQLMGLSRGYTQAMTLTGSAWALLGVWKGAAVETGTFTETGQRATVDFLDGKVSINVEASRRALAAMGTLAATLHSHGRGAVAATAVATETRHLDQAEETELRWHLLQGFVHQLAAVKLGAPVASAPEAPSVHATDIMSRYTLNVPWDAARLVDWRGVRDLEAACPLSNGVYFGLQRPARGAAAKSLDVDGWTWVPLGLVRRWMRLQGENPARLFDVLRRRIPIGMSNEGEL